MTVEERLALLERTVADLLRVVSPPAKPITMRDVAPSSARQPPKAEDRDPTVKIMPRNWDGPDLRGKRYSECPPRFLGMLGHMLDSFAIKNQGNPDPEQQRYAKWDAENAESARRWRARLEAEAAEGQP